MVHLQYLKDDHDDSPLVYVEFGGESRCNVRHTDEDAVSDDAHDADHLQGTLRDTHGTVRYGTVRYGTVRYGTVRYGTVRYGTVRYGTVRYNTITFNSSKWEIHPI